MLKAILKATLILTNHLVGLGPLVQLLYTTQAQCVSVVRISFVLITGTGQDVLTLVRAPL